MDCLEAQQEELEVLRSIYEGDDRFKIVNDTTFQYKIGDEENKNSFLVEIGWGGDYPNEKPTINMDTFYNKQMPLAGKKGIAEQLLTEAEANLGMAMTYALIEWTKENAEALFRDHVEQSKVEEVSRNVEVLAINNQQSESVTKDKKIQLTKSQKRKMYNQLDSKGQKTRGWDWVDVIKHLSQSGSGTEKGTLGATQVYGAVVS